MLRQLERALARRRVRRRDTRFGAPEVDTSLPRGSDRIPGFEHLVVLMMENHSFDNYLGMLGRGDGFTRDDNGVPTDTNSSADGRIVPLRRRSTKQLPTVPSQAWHASHMQYGDGRNDGFVTSIEDM